MFARLGSLFFFLVFVLPWVTMTAAFDYLAASNLVRQARTASWPSVQGTVIRSEVTSVRSNKSTNHGLKLAYTYSVDGQSHEGSTVQITESMSGDRGVAEEQMARYPVGASVPVYYQPEQPSEAVLKAGLDSSELFLFMLMTPFNLIAFWLGRAVVGSWKSEPPLLSTFAREDGSECVTLEGPWTAALVSLVLFGSAVVCFLLTAGTMGLDAPLPVGVGAWAVVIACGVYAGRWSRARERAGHYDLRLIARSRSLSLPPYLKRRHRLDVRWSDVLSLRVEPQLRKPPAKEVGSYQLTLEFSTGDGEVRQEAITSFYQQDKADALAHWLRKHLKVGEAVPEEQRSA
ncbi:DUF3592 domain-containing protein [Myxococcus eversor]|uniref:DUF3592 domain-containing protein n=1 Tax=Myxococcus eversor TaxID=2709661 RepID=UPI0013D112B9|nr:DUF3592 domain-containing protein [Myxococcus eversor]